MKVVRKPDHSDWAWNFTCYECTAELEACATDVEASVHSSTWVFHATCPICTTKRQIPASEIPKGLQFELKDRHTKSQPVRTWTGDR